MQEVENRSIRYKHLDLLYNIALFASPFYCSLSMLFAVHNESSEGISYGRVEFVSVVLIYPFLALCILSAAFFLIKKYFTVPLVIQCVVLMVLVAISIYAGFEATAMTNF